MTKQHTPSNDFSITRNGPIRLSKVRYGKDGEFVIEGIAQGGDYYKIGTVHVAQHGNQIVTAVNTFRTREQEIAELREALGEFCEWNKKYPSTRIYNETSIRRIAGELDAVYAKAVAALAKGQKS